MRSNDAASQMPGALLKAAGRLLLLALLANLIGCGRDGEPTPIAQGFGLGSVPAFTGRPAIAQPVIGTPVAQHPFMA